MIFHKKRLYTKFFYILILAVLLLIACAPVEKGNDKGDSVTSESDENNESTEHLIGNNGLDHQQDGNNDETTDSSDVKDSSPDENPNQDNPAPADSEEESPGKPSEKPLEQKIQEKIAAMKLEQKVAQIFMITPEALTGYENVTVASNITKNALMRYPVGGLIYFGGNIVTPEQVKNMTTNTQKYAEEIEGIPLFLGIDEEGGIVARIGNNSNFSVKKYANMATIGATKDLDKAYEVGATIGGYLQQYGFNLDFAPDADVLTNPDNTVIGSRSFGSDGNLVAEMDISVARGLTDHQVLPCFKHFPGHGATEGDTHEGFAYTNKTLDELQKNELVPFQAAVENHIPFIMISHISVPNIIGDNTPSSLSKMMITDILRKQMGFEGIIITDSMSMGAIVNSYGAKEAVIQSIQAGADIILMPQDFVESYQGVLDAVTDGIISEERLDESLERILRVKFSMITNENVKY